MEDIYLDLGADLQISEDSLLFLDDNNSLSSTDEVMSGPPGPQGPKGDPGFSPVANVTQTSSGATISITDETGTTTANITNGINGSDGQDGADGAAATIEVGEVTTLLPTDSAVVTNSGTSSAAVFNFGIPQGQQGIQGIQGIQGDPGVSPRAVVEQTASGATITIEDYQTVTTADIYNGVDGQDGQDGAPGADGQAATITVGSTTTGNAGTNASVTNSGTSSAAVLDFVIPRGADGAPGQDGADGAPGAPGADGQAATIAVGTTTTGAAGTNASVTNSGTSSAAVFNFTIPRGADGAPGQDGAPGADGVTPSITASASVNSSTGTPSVSVTKSGTDANPNFAFAFSNLKGETGAQGPTGYQPTVLFTGSSSGDVLLNQSADSFDYIEIYGHENGGRPIYIKLVTPVLNVKFVMTATFFVGTYNTLYIRTKSYTFTSGTQITANSSDNGEIQIKTSGNSISGAATIYIDKVVGFKIN